MMTNHEHDAQAIFVQATRLRVVLVYSKSWIVSSQQEKSESQDKKFAHAFGGRSIRTADSGGLVGFQVIA